MRYFTFCPMDMSEAEAFKRAEPHLRDLHVVHVSTTSISIVSLQSVRRLRATRDTYLVRVEPDHSLRIVDRNIGD